MTERKKAERGKKLAGGVHGAQSHARGTAKRHGAFVGANALRGAGANVVSLEEWEFVDSYANWSRRKMARYLLEWLNDQSLLRGPVDLPSFSQLVTACMLIQRASKLQKEFKEDAVKYIDIGSKIVGLWDKVYSAIGHMNLKEAQTSGARRNVNEAALGEYE